MSEETENVEQSTEEQNTASRVETAEDGTIKVNLAAFEDPAPSQEVEPEEKQEEVVNEVEETSEAPVLEEVVEQEVEQPTEEVEATKEQVEQINEELDNNPGLDLPENVEDLVKFMNETGGSLEDYVRLNADYSSVDDKALLKEYYKSKKKNLTDEEISFLIEDKFAFDEELDEENDVKRKKLAFKEEVGDARDFLNGLKDKYYKEVKLGSKLLPEQREAVEFFNRYNEQQKETEKLASTQKERFEQETNKVFNDEFKGFEFNVGEKKYRYNVKDVSAVREQQSDLLNVFGKYIENNMLTNGRDYHKSLFAAANPDAIANHFYEQGRADAIKGVTAGAKNINMDARKTANEYVDAAGVKVRVVSGDSGSKLKMKIKR
jgi:hypothetical protein|tara:strand:- start:419 stop:1549 length:1131 start_codon:yes stop_codon:yes gene_type:complete